MNLELLTAATDVSKRRRANSVQSPPTNMRRLRSFFVRVRSAPIATTADDDQKQQQQQKRSNASKEYNATAASRNLLLLRHYDDNEVCQSSIQHTSLAPPSLQERESSGNNAAVRVASSTHAWGMMMLGRTLAERD